MFSEVITCSMACATQAQERMTREQRLRDYVPASYIEVNGVNHLVQVPTAEPPEWYAEYLVDVEMRGKDWADERTNLKRSEDEWANIRYSDHDTLVQEDRHEVWL